MDKEKMDGKIAARLRVQRYRAKHRRIDYVPGAEVLAIIQKHQKLMPRNLAGVIDALIFAADEATTGNESCNKGVS